MTHYHFIGIGGSGLSAIARVLLERGEMVSGSDRQATPITQALQAAGATVWIGHQARNIQGADLVVRSSAIPNDNEEILAALDAGIPVIKRAEFMAELLRGYQAIAIAGTHGKTTTTAMIAWLLTALGEDPSFIIGGVALNLNTNAHSGQGRYFVIEADEYDYMFLGIAPAIAVVTNIEHDHPDCYPTAESFYQAFHNFAEQLVPGGSLFGCLEDPGGRRLMDEMIKTGMHVLKYGTRLVEPDIQPDYYASELAINQSGGYDFQVFREDELLGSVHLQVPGVHNVRNALAALAVVDQLGLPFEDAANSLSEFRGTGRRFDVRGEARGITVIDDYAHHPTEIKATLAAARGRYPERELWAVWQPHTYTRTRALFSGFVSAFKDADHVLVTEVYAAREEPPANGFSAEQVVAAMQHPDVRFVPDSKRAVSYLLGSLEPQAVLIVLSAGDADQISQGVLRALA
jgi:UDP-N-acetylmuramate--alanine ligase